MSLVAVVGAGTCFTRALFRYRRYAATPEPPGSLEAFHDTSIWLQFMAFADTPAGTEGGVESTGGCVVVVEVLVDVELVVGRVLEVELLVELVELLVDVLVDVVVGRVVDVLDELVVGGALDELVLLEVLLVEELVEVVVGRVVVVELVVDVVG